MSAPGDVTNREHFEQLLAAQEKQVAERFRSMEQRLDASIETQRALVSAALEAVSAANAKQERADEARFASLNEFRGALSDQQKSLPTRIEVEAAMAVISTKVDGLNERIALQGERLTRIEGKGAGISLAWAVVLGAAGLIGAVLTIASRLMP